MNDVRVGTLDELRKHLTIEIIEHFRSGLLAKWLESRDFKEELDEIEHMAEHGLDDEALTLKELCRIFGIETDDHVIDNYVTKSAVRKKTGERSIPLDPLLAAQQLIEEIMAKNES